VFRYAHARGADAAQSCARQLGRLPGGLGFVYFTDALVADPENILSTLRSRTGVSSWVGTVGTGVIATGVEYQDEPAVAAMVADIEAFSVFSGRAPIRRGQNFAVAHADPGAPDLPGLVSDLSARVASGYVVGGISSSRARTVQIANEVLAGGLSGASFGPEVAVATRHTQGCTPYPGRFRVTEGADHVIMSLDGRPALEVLREAVGEKPREVLVGVAVPGSDTGDYTARNLLGIDPDSGAIAIGEALDPGAELVFLRRDAAAARADLERVLGELKAGPPARGALYYSCVARGEHLFGSRGAELGVVRRALGDVPLVGFFCNGEISHDRLYGYTGVLTLFH
jgi:small ligand-binding sensory domain FIST